MKNLRKIRLLAVAMLLGFYVSAVAFAMPAENIQKAAGFSSEQAKNRSFSDLFDEFEQSKQLTLAQALLAKVEAIENALQNQENFGDEYDEYGDSATGGKSFYDLRVEVLYRILSSNISQLISAIGGDVKEVNDATTFLAMLELYEKTEKNDVAALFNIAYRLFTKINEIRADLSNQDAHKDEIDEYGEFLVDSEAGYYDLEYRNLFFLAKDTTNIVELQRQQQLAEENLLAAIANAKDLDELRPLEADARKMRLYDTAYIMRSNVLKAGSETVGVDLAQRIEGAKVLDDLSNIEQSLVTRHNLLKKYVAKKEYLEGQGKLNATIAQSPNLVTLESINLKDVKKYALSKEYEGKHSDLVKNMDVADIKSRSEIAGWLIGRADRITDDNSRELFVARTCSNILREESRAKEDCYIAKLFDIMLKDKAGYDKGMRILQIAYPMDLQKTTQLAFEARFGKNYVDRVKKIFKNK